MTGEVPLSNPYVHEAQHALELLFKGVDFSTALHANKHRAFRGVKGEASGLDVNISETIRDEVHKIAVVVYPYKTDRQTWRSYFYYPGANKLETRYISKPFQDTREFDAVDFEENALQYFNEHMERVTTASRMEEELGLVDATQKDWEEFAGIMKRFKRVERKTNYGDEK